MRLLYSSLIAALCSWSIFISLARRGKIVLSGVIIGGVLGILFSIADLVHLNNKARKNEFTLEGSKGNFLLLIICFMLLGLFFLLTIFKIVGKYFPGLDPVDTGITIPFSAFALFFSMSTAGIYRVERKYNNQFRLPRK